MELTKDKTIRQLLSHLEQTFGKDSFRVNDYWDENLCAIGLADLKGKYLLDLNTYGKQDNTFNLELEDRNANRTTEQ
jgi:hypothetical protein